MSERVFYVMLRRLDSKRKGVQRFTYQGKMYRRGKVYRVSQSLRDYLVRGTGMFEDVLPEDLEEAKKIASQRTGVALGVDGAGLMGRRVKQMPDAPEVGPVRDLKFGTTKDNAVENVGIADEAPDAIDAPPSMSGVEV